MSLSIMSDLLIHTMLIGLVHYKCIDDNTEITSPVNHKEIKNALNVQNLIGYDTKRIFSRSRCDALAYQTTYIKVKSNTRATLLNSWGTLNHFATPNPVTPIYGCQQGYTCCNLRKCMQIIKTCR